LPTSIKRSGVQVGIWVFILQEEEQFSLKYKLCLFSNDIITHLLGSGGSTTLAQYEE